MSKGRYVYETDNNNISQQKGSILNFIRCGLPAGLELTVNIDQGDYHKAAGDTAGMKLVVHSADRLTFPEDEGLTISPGRTTSIGLRKVRKLSRRVV